MSTIEFNELLLDNADPLKPFASNLTREPEIAKDLFQETLCRALVNQDKYQPGSNIKAWLFTIMRNIFINEYRRQSRQRTAFEDGSGKRRTELRKVTTNNEGESLLEMKQALHAIDRLPQIYKTPFLLYFEGYRYQEISTLLNEPLGTIKSRIHFARKLLRDQISKN